MGFTLHSDLWTVLLPKFNAQCNTAVTPVYWQTVKKTAYLMCSKQIPLVGFYVGWCNDVFVLKITVQWELWIWKGLTIPKGFFSEIWWSTLFDFILARHHRNSFRVHFPTEFRSFSHVDTGHLSRSCGSRCDSSGCNESVVTEWRYRYDTFIIPWTSPAWKAAKLYPPCGWIMG